MKRPAKTEDERIARSERASKNAKMFWNGDKAKIDARNATASITQQARWDATTDEQRKEHGAKAIAGMSEEGRHAWETSKEKVWYDSEIQARKSKKMQEYHASLTEEERDTYNGNISTGVKQAWVDGKLDYSGTKTWYHPLPSGRQFRVQSSWEAELAEMLERWGVKFERGPRVQLVNHSWMPDFLIDDHLLLEVKGHPLAIQQFDANQRQEIPLADLPYSVAILTIKPSKTGANSLDELLGMSEWLRHSNREAVI